MFSSKFLLIVVFFVNHCMSHTYSPGSCSYVERINDFDMTKLLGRWYAIQKTTTQSTCLIYSFEKGLKPGEYFLKQTSERYPTHLNISYVFDYTGKIKTEKNSSKMTIHFPLNIAGSASFDVITTDYETYAGIYTCQNLLFFKRQSATFLSRTSKLNPDILKKMRHMFDENISDLQLNVISHDNCNAADSQIFLKVKSNLESSINVSRMVPTLPIPSIPNLNKEIDRRIADVSYEEPCEEHTSDAENFIDPRFLDDDDGYSRILPK